MNKQTQIVGGLVVALGALTSVVLLSKVSPSVSSLRSMPAETVSSVPIEPIEPSVSIGNPIEPAQLDPLSPRKCLELRTKVAELGERDPQRLLQENPLLAKEDTLPKCKEMGVDTNNPNVKPGEG